MTTCLYVWRTPASAVPRVMWRMARDPLRLRRDPRVRFAKLLGTAPGSDFGPGRIDWGRWAAVIVWDGPERPDALRRWTRIATASCRLRLHPLSARGRWGGRTPLPEAEPPAETETGAGDRPVLALTHARLRPSRAPVFWRAIGSVAASLADSPGLLAAFGIGEAPVGYQGTVSVWRRPADLIRFAYRLPQHRRVIEQTVGIGWYAEEFFARFAVVDAAGDTGVIGWG